MKKVVVRSDTYFDSVLLMRIDRELKQLDGVKETVVAMATPHNREILADLQFASSELENAGPNDLVIAVEAKDEEALERALAEFDALVDRTRKAPAGAGGAA